MLFPLLFSHPIALKRRQTGHNTSPDPSWIDAFLWDYHRHGLDLGVRRGQFTDFWESLLHCVGEEHVATREEDVGVELFLDVDVAAVDVVRDEGG